MQDIDFLPVQYRRQHVQRQSKPWRIVVVAAFALLLAAGAVGQFRSKRRAEEELAAITPQYDAVVARNDELAKMRQELETLRLDAELFTYLRHPWPRTQLLRALLEPLPEAIELQRLQITREAVQGQTATERRSRSERQAEAEEAEKLPPAQRDLKQLREQFDVTQTVVQISGTTGDSAALHVYVAVLNGAGLFDKAEIDSFDRLDAPGDPRWEFQATLRVHPGYGQPGGPDKPPELASLDDKTLENSLAENQLWAVYERAVYEGAVR